MPVEIKNYLEGFSDREAAIRKIAEVDELLKSKEKEILAV